MQVHPKNIFSIIKVIDAYAFTNKEVYHDVSSNNRSFRS